VKLPLQISTRKLSLSQAAENTIRQKAEKLETFYRQIIACRVMVETPHRRKNHGTLYNVRIDLTVPGGELVVKREPHEDVYVAIRDAFDAARRQLQSYSRRRRGAVKVHVSPPVARVTKIFSDEGFGFLETNDGREIYFHSNSVIDADFSFLRIGSQVRFAEKQGVNGPQASAVSPL